MESTKKHEWTYCSVGGVVRVSINSGEDIAHLGELDQKLWTVLSCPVEGLEFDAETLRLIDTDGDGKIRVPEVVAAAEWLTSVVKDKDLILKGSSSIALDQIDTASPDGAKLYDSARRILSNLGLEKDEISVADTSDSVAIFANTRFNGDGIITPASTDDEELKATIAAISSSVGSAMDRSGEAGVDAGGIEAFYAALAGYSAWKSAGEAAEVLPYGADTPAALAACDAIKDKIADYFMRCKLIGFDADAAAAVDVPVDKISAISGDNLATRSEHIAGYPLARPSKLAKIPFDAVNPAWSEAFASVKSLVLDKDFPGADSLDEAQWESVLAKLGPYRAWIASKAGDAVEPLGLEAVAAFLKADRKAELLALVDQDNAVAAEASGIDEVCKLTRLYRDFARLLNNYVIFSDFYNRSSADRAIFECGELFIDQRCCHLCVRVKDMGKHADMAALSGMFLIYCTCSSKTKGETMDIVAVMTSGSIWNLRPGLNGVFYDLDGGDWDAVVTKVVENPISVRAAFWSPYRKLARFVSDKIDKAASDKDSAATAMLQTKAEGGAAKPAFDIGKFAGITAIATIAVAAITGAVAAIGAFLASLKWWQIIVLIAAIMLIISGPACFIAWRKLRKRNLGPVLNANGWAINSNVLVNILFGSALTTTAKYPRLNLQDPYAPKTPVWRKVLRIFLPAVVVAFGVLFFTDNLKFIGIQRYKDAPAGEVVVEEAVPADEPAAVAPAAEPEV